MVCELVEPVCGWLLHAVRHAIVFTPANVPMFLLPFQSATPVTIRAASGQVKTAPGVGGWRSVGRGWRAETWRSKRTKEEGLSAGNTVTSGKKKKWRTNRR